MSKAEAVRRALKAGIEKPQEGSEWIKAKFGLDVPPKHFSIAKSQEKAREGKESSGRKPSGGKSQKEIEFGNGFVGKGDDGFVPTELMRELFVLVEKYGKAELKEALSVFGD